MLNQSLAKSREFSEKKIKRRAVGPLPEDNHPSLSPLLSRVLSARGVVDPEECDMSLNKLLPPEHLKGCLQAACLLADALETQSRLLFIGDFDADGATSTALGIAALRAFGAQYVDFLVPNRFDFGYGLTPEIVAVAKDKHPQVLITVDNGISSLEGVKAAKALGWKVIITDHHLPGKALPEADVIVNPNQTGCNFPSKSLAGVGVIFYVMMALRAELRRRQWFAKKHVADPNLGQLLDLVALGTVADVVPLDRNNRILVNQGIRRIRSGHCQPGILALLECAGRCPDQLVSADLGFAVGPRLNAAGRLEDMSLGVNCLLASDAETARQIAANLDDLNNERKAIERDMKGTAQIALAQLEELDDGIPSGICLYDENWHQGVIGILASRIKERYYRPVIAFANAGEGEIKGSARSVAGVHIRDCLDAVAGQHPGLLAKFGGHAMAAGLSLRLEHFDAFRTAFQQQVAGLLSEENLQATVFTDGELQPAELFLECAEELRTAFPWGQGFPEPSFEGVFRVVHARIVGECHLKVRLHDPRSGMRYEGIYFNADSCLNPRELHQVRIVYRLDINEYMGSRKLQLLIEYLKPVY